MAEGEYNAMVETGLVQAARSAGGKDMTWVTNPPSKSSFRAGVGGYAEFDVPSSNLAQGGREDWGVVFGPNSLHGKKYGSPYPGMPPHQNLGPFERQ
jgi:hypothetical protein